MIDVVTDVLIVGGGLAGWRAAEAAAGAGCAVTLVANGVGNSPDVHALNCPVLVEDSVARYVADTMSSGRGANDRALVETMCRESLTLKEEFAFDETVIRPLGSTVPRCVSIDHAIGALALQRLKAKLAGKVTFVQATVTAMGYRREGAAETRGTPETAGAAETFAAQLDTGDCLEARAVVLATGGWCGKYAFSTNPSYMKGDGLAFAQALGGAVRDVDEAHVQYEPTVRTEGPRRGVPVITTLLYKGARLVNAAGEDILPDARLNKDELSRAIFAEMNRREGAAETAGAAETTGTAETTGAAETVGAGVWYDLTGVSAAALRDCKMDPAERRIRVAPAAHSSLGGVVIDTACRVLDAEGRVVPGLFACGEVTAGVHGLNRLGGNGGTAAMVFGRIAGVCAAKFIHGEGS